MSISIKILGTGCPKCNQVTAVVKQVVEENNIDATIEKVEDIMDIMQYDVMSTPAIVVNNEVKIKGRVPSKDEVKEILLNKDAAKDSGDCCSPSSSCC